MNDTEKFLENYFAQNREIAEKEYTFRALPIGSSITIVERKYIDISHVNYWIDGDGNHIYKVYMRNGEILDVDNLSFNTEYCPHGVNVINEVCKREYL